MTLADKRQQMMFTQRVEFDVLDQHHFIGLTLEHGSIDNLFQALGITPGKKLHGLGSTLGGVLQPLAFGVFTQPENKMAIKVGEFFGHVQACDKRKQRLWRWPGHQDIGGVARYRHPTAYSIPRRWP